MKKINGSLLFLMMLVAVMPTAKAALSYLPQSNIEAYNGYSMFNQNGISGHLEFAVYDTDIQSVSGLESLSGYENEKYIYAYQIFCTSGSEINSFKLLGFNPDTLISDENMGTTNTLDGSLSYGVDATSWLFGNDEAVWFFEGGALITGAQSYFLVMFSDSDPTIGTYEINPIDNGDILIEGGNDTNSNNVPEPATLVLLLSGSVLAVRRKK